MNISYRANGLQSAASIAASLVEFMRKNKTLFIDNGILNQLLSDKNKDVAERFWGDAEAHKLVAQDDSFEMRPLLCTSLVFEFLGLTLDNKAFPSLAYNGEYLSSESEITQEKLKEIWIQITANLTKEISDRWSKITLKSKLNERCENSKNEHPISKWVCRLIYNTFDEHITKHYDEWIKEFSKKISWNVLLQTPFIKTSQKSDDRNLLKPALSILQEIFIENLYRGNLFGFARLAVREFKNNIAKPETARKMLDAAQIKEHGACIPCLIQDNKDLMDEDGIDMILFGLRTPENKDCAPPITFITQDEPEAVLNRLRIAKTLLKAQKQDMCPCYGEIIFVDKLSGAISTIHKVENEDESLLNYAPNIKDKGRTVQATTQSTYNKLIALAP